MTAQHPSRSRPRGKPLTVEQGRLTARSVDVFDSWRGDTADNPYIDAVRACVRNLCTSWDGETSSELDEETPNSAGHVVVQYLVVCGVVDVVWIGRP